MEVLLVYLHEKLINNFYRLHLILFLFTFIIWVGSLIGGIFVLSADVLESSLQGTELSGLSQGSHASDPNLNPNPNPNPNPNTNPVTATGAPNTTDTDTLADYLAVSKDNGMGYLRDTAIRLGTRTRSVHPVISRTARYIHTHYPGIFNQSSPQSTHINDALITSIRAFNMNVPLNFN